MSVICVDLSRQGAQMIGYGGAHTYFAAICRVKTKATLVHVHPLGSMELRHWFQHHHVVPCVTTCSPDVPSLELYDAVLACPSVVNM
jgi:hypothetical protein